MTHNRFLKPILIVLLLAVFIISPLIAQSPDQTGTPRGRQTRVLVDEEVFDDEIIERVPEASLQPRTRTEEIRFTLKHFRELLLESNKQLY